MNLRPVSSFELFVTGFKWGKRQLHLFVSVKIKTEASHCLLDEVCDAVGC